MSEAVTLSPAEHALIATAAVAPHATEYDYPELVEVIEQIIADRLRPVREILDAWDAWDGSRHHPDASSPRDRERLRRALSTPPN